MNYHLRPVLAGLLIVLLFTPTSANAMDEWSTPAIVNEITMMKGLGLLRLKMQMSLGVNPASCSTFLPVDVPTNLPPGVPAPPGTGPYNLYIDIRLDLDSSAGVGTDEVKLLTDSVFLSAIAGRAISFLVSGQECSSEDSEFERLVAIGTKLSP